MAYTETELLTKLRTLADDLGRSPTTRELNARENMPSQHAYSNHFGSWANALNEAELLALQSNKQSYKTDKKLKKLLRELAGELGRPPTSRELNAREGFPTVGMYESRFGSWSTALNEAGLDPEPIQRPYTDEELIEMVKELADELGRPPTSNELNARDEMPSKDTYQYRFGSWTVSLEYAGFEPHYQNGPPLEKLLIELRGLCSSFEEIPARSTLENHASVALATYEDRFGSWQTAVEAVGFADASDTG